MLNLEGPQGVLLGESKLHPWDNHSLTVSYITVQGPSEAAPLPDTYPQLYENPSVHSPTGVILLLSVSFQGLPGPEGHFLREHLMTGERSGPLPQEQDESHRAESQDSQHPQCLHEVTLQQPY